MGMSLDQFAAQCRDALKSHPGAEGRQKVCALVEAALQDPGFVATYIPEGTPERKVLYEDPELGFAILAHAYTGAKNSKPHDHGPSWAIYGQASGETEMTDYELVAAAAEGKPGKARSVRTYKLTPGTAYLYNEGDLHSPRRRDATQLIRIEGMNMDRIKRLKYDPI